MTTLTNATGTKKVNIRKNDSSFIASYVQIYQGMEQVLLAKTFSNIKNAEKWSNKILNN
jgi:hypothetical protein